MRFWRDVSGEITVAPLPDSPVDVAVVGAGFTGLSTALLLARTGQRVAVVEARHVGAGASGATTAKTSLLQNTRLSDLADRHSPEVAAQYLAANRHGLEWLAQFCTAHDVPVQRTPAVTFSTTDDGADAVRREYELARELGLDVTLDEHPVEEFATHAALRLPDMLQLDPADLLAALCRVLTEAGGTVTDHTRVTGIDGTTLRTNAGELRAGRVVLATASPILDTGRVTMSLSPERSYLCAYDVDGPLPEGMYISAESPTISVRRAGGKLLVGGQGHPTGQETRTRERLEALDTWAEHHFPGARRTHGWSAQDYHPVGGVPVVEKLSDGVVFAGGYGKWGMAAAPAAAHMLVDLLDGREPESFGDTTSGGTARTTASTLAKAAGHAAANLASAVTGGDTRGPDDSSTLDEGDAATAHGYTVAVAESLTGGTLAAELAATEGSSDWFAGGVVAYQSRTKQAVLGVPADCPVISAQCVTTMAATLADLVTADAVVAISGAGGPGGQEGQPPGTTWFATLVRGRATTHREHFPGSPEEVLAAARSRALELLAEEMRRSSPTG